MNSTLFWNEDFRGQEGSLLVTDIIVLVLIYASNLYNKFNLYFCVFKYGKFCENLEKKYGDCMSIKWILKPQ